jgi:hypothetical protein
VTRAVLRSLVPVICPPAALPLADAIVDHVALTLGASPWPLRRGFAAGLIAYDLGALPGYRRRARSLTAAAAERYFTAWEHGPTPLHVQLARATNQLLSLACYEMPAMMERVGYRPGPWIAEVRQRRLAVYADDVRRRAGEIIAPDPLRRTAHVDERSGAVARGIEAG